MAGINEVINGNQQWDIIEDQHAVQYDNADELPDLDAELLELHDELQDDQLPIILPIKNNQPITLIPAPVNKHSLNQLMAPLNQTPLS